MSAQEWECLATKKIGDDVSGTFALNAGSNRFNGIADFSDDMASYVDQSAFDANWVTTDTGKIRGNPSTDVIDHTTLLNIGFYVVCNFDLWSHGIFPSDSNWTLRAKWDLTTVTNPGGAGGINLNLHFGISDLGLKSKTVTQDFIVARASLANGTSLWRGYSGENIQMALGPVFTLAHDVQVETLFVELKRTSVTNFEMTFYSDASFTTIIEKGRGTINGNPINLRFITIVFENQGGASGRILDGTLTEIQFFNNTEGLTEHFVLHGDEDLDLFVDPVFPSPTKFFDFSSSTGWVQASTEVAIAGGILKGTAVISGGGTYRAIQYDLDGNDGIILDDDTWTAEFELNFTNSTDATDTVFWFSSVDSDPNVGSQDVIGIGHGVGNNANQLRIFFTNGGTTGSATYIALAQAISLSLSTVYFIRLERYGRNNIKLSVFTDSGRTTLLAPPQIFASVPITLTNLFVVGSSNVSGGGTDGPSTWEIDNLNIYNGFSPSRLGFSLDEDFSSYGTSVNPDFVDVFNSETGWVTADATRVRVEEDQGFAFAMSPNGVLARTTMTFDLGAVFLGTPTFQDDFSGADNWADQGTRIAVNTGQDRIDYDTIRDGTLQATVNDRTSVNDIKWTLRYKLDIQNWSQPSSENLALYGGIKNGDETINTQGTNQDALIFETTYASGGAQLFRLRACNNQGFDGGTVSTFTLTPSASIFYIELVRVSAILGEATIYSDALYTIPLETQTVVMSAGTSSLRYIFFNNANDQTSVGGANDGFIDDVEFWDNITPAPTLAIDVRVTNVI